MPQQSAPAPEPSPAPAQPAQPAQAAPTAPPAPAADLAPATATPQVVAGGPPTAEQMYQGAKAQREELGRQLEGLEERRQELSNRLRDHGLNDVDKQGLERRLTDVDGRIAEVEKQIAQADANVAKAAAVPGAVVEQEPQIIYRDNDEEAVFATLGISTPIWIVMLLLLRRRWKKGAPASREGKDLATQLTRVEQSVESIALEVERIGEAQRFTARVLAERDDPRALGAGAAEPLSVRQRESVERGR